MYLMVCLFFFNYQQHSGGKGGLTWERKYNLFNALLVDCAILFPWGSQILQGETFRRQ